MKRLSWSWRNKKTALGVIVVLVLGCLAWAYRDRFDREAIVSFGRSLPRPSILAAFFFLPLIGFPISILLVIVGIRFGFPGGMAVAAGGVLFHNLAAYKITHGFLRDPLRKRLEKSGRPIPDVKVSNQIWFTALFAAIHGPPYAIKIYSLALTNIRFRVYLWVGAPVYWIFCAVPVGAGSAVTTLDPRILYWIVAISAAVLAAGIAIRRTRLAARMKE